MAKESALRRKTKRISNNPAGRINKLEQMAPEAYEEMLLYVRGGAYDSVAAKSLGVSPGTFAHWKALGAEHDEQDTESPYRQLFRDLLVASGKARLAAEITVKKISPLTWLRSGPGRPIEHEQGWSEDKQIVQHEGGSNPLQVDHVHRILGENPTERTTAIAGALEVLRELQIDPAKAALLLSSSENSTAEAEEEQDLEEGELVPDVESGYHANGNGKS